jgi:hypothetical protein
MPGGTSTCFSEHGTTRNSNREQHASSFVGAQACDVAGLFVFGLPFFALDADKGAKQDCGAEVKCDR